MCGSMARKHPTHFYGIAYRRYAACGRVRSRKFASKLYCKSHSLQLRPRGCARACHNYRRLRRGHNGFAISRSRKLSLRRRIAVWCSSNKHYGKHELHSSSTMKKYARGRVKCSTRNRGRPFSWTPNSPFISSRTGHRGRR